MSKSENIFLIVKERRAREAESALLAACEYLSNCKWCPLEETEKCVEKSLPPAALGEDKKSYCIDWIYLHYWAKVKP